MISPVSTGQRITATTDDATGLTLSTKVNKETAALTGASVPVATVVHDIDSNDATQTAISNRQRPPHAGTAQPGQANHNLGSILDQLM